MVATSVTVRSRANHQAPARLLEAALVFTIVAHAWAMISMAALLLPGMPGGPQTDGAARAAYVAGHPWLWRAGWLAWQVTAASDLLLCIALLRTAWIPKTPAVIATVATVAGMIPDQLGQFRWTWAGVELARGAASGVGLGRYLEFESGVFRSIAGWGTVGYLLGALGWTWCFAAAGSWCRGLTRLSVVTWGTFALATVVVFLPAGLRESRWLGAAVAGGNAVAFVLLMTWLAWVSEIVMRRSRPPTTHGVGAPWRHPSRAFPARGAELIANSRLARTVGRALPSLAMASDIEDVVYINYLVEADRLAPLVSSPLAIQRLGPQGRFALFTFLTYRHGCFGPVCFGPLRRAWPSPVQSNWRVYVEDPRTRRRGIQFLTTAITSTPHALATRLLAEGVPMHVPASATVDRGSGGEIAIVIDPGAGTAPDVRGSLAETVPPALEPRWSLCFGSWREFLAYCVPQDRALTVSAEGRVARQEIVLDIPIESCVPLAGRVLSRAAEALVGGEVPISFLVPRVAFRFEREVIDG